MAYTPSVTTYTIINNDPNSTASPSPSTIYWVPTAANVTGNNTGPYYNVNSNTNEIFSYIEFEDYTNTALVTGGTWTVTVTNGDLYNGGNLVVATPASGSTPMTTTLTGTITSGQTYPLAALSFTPIYGGLQPQVQIFYSAPGSSAIDARAAYNVYCFAEGTSIACPEGLRAIETLSAGDLVLNADGIACIIRFVGRRAIDLTHDRHNAPVRIPAGAIADGVPSHDLRLSPEHAVVMEGVLIPVRSLIGEVVVQEIVDHVVYYHIQLDSHDIVMADNTPCETLLNTDYHDEFDNEDDAVVSDAFLAPCLPRVTQGREVEAARAHLKARVLTAV
jgi:hypothetical protein